MNTKRPFDGSPTPLRRITYAEAFTPPRRISKLRTSNTNYVGRPTLVALIAGGSSDMSTALVDDWEGEARNAQVNFVAIEIGDGAGSDPDPPTLLGTNVPPGASVYIVLRDERVSDDEIEQLREVLDRQQIPHEGEALVPGEERAWNMPPVLETAPIVDEAFEHPHLTRCAYDFHPHPTAEQFFAHQRAETRKLEAQARMLNFEIKQNAALTAETRHLIDAIDPEQKHKRSLKPAIIEAFHKLQVTAAWQRATRTAGAKALCGLLVAISLEKRLQDDVEGVLEDLLLGLGNDADVLDAVLGDTARLPGDLDSGTAIAMIYIAYMKQCVTLGKLDDTPRLDLALDFAHRVQRYHLMEELAAASIEEMEDSAEQDPGLEDKLYDAFDKALMNILLHGGKRELPPVSEEGPIADAVEKAWLEMKQRGDAGFKEFLASWSPWLSLVSRRQARLKAEREAQEAMT